MVRGPCGCYGFPQSTYLKLRLGVCRESELRAQLAYARRSLLVRLTEYEQFVFLLCQLELSAARYVSASWRDTWTRDEHCGAPAASRAP